jgi:hypothetical protein
VREAPREDIVGALACTFACEYATLPARDWDSGRGDYLVQTEWNPFSDERMRDDGMQPAGRLQMPRYYAEGWARLRDDDAA